MPCYAKDMFDHPNDKNVLNSLVFITVKHHDVTARVTQDQTGIITTELSPKLTSELSKKPKLSRSLDNKSSAFYKEKPFKMYKTTSCSYFYKATTWHDIAVDMWYKTNCCFISSFKLNSETFDVLDTNGIDDLDINGIEPDDFNINGITEPGLLNIIAWSRIESPEGVCQFKGHSIVIIDIAKRGIAFVFENPIFVKSDIALVLISLSPPSFSSSIEPDAPDANGSIEPDAFCTNGSIDPDTLDTNGSSSVSILIRVDIRNWSCLFNIS